jgi:formate hydrogenlyase subunit 6/NADH:ubiquinone oxidoreductase subunit I
MNILTMLWKNLRRGYQTLLFPARPKITARFRGLVEFDPAFCTGCAVCRMRCTSRAIEFKAGKGEFTWSYNPGQCTFCGRCVEGCIEHALKEGHTEHALSQQQDTPPIYVTQGELKKSYTVARRPPAPKPSAASVAPAPSSVAPAVSFVAPVSRPAVLAQPALSLVEGSTPPGGDSQ